MFSKPIPPCTHMLHVFICMYTHVCMCVSLCKCICVRTHVQTHVVYNTIFACVSVVSWCICAYDLSIFLFSLSLSETNIVLQYERYTAVSLWHGQFLSKSWQETNHYLSVKARCGLSFVSSIPVLISASANVVTHKISCHIGSDRVIMALHCSIKSQNFALLPCFFAPCFDNYSLWNRD